MRALVIFALVIGFSPAFGETRTALAAAIGGIDSNAFRSASVSWVWLRPLDFVLPLKVGGGARYTYISKSGGLAVGPSQSWNVSSVSLGAANLMFFADFELSEKLELGLNIDVLGFSHGPTTNVRSGSIVDTAKVRSSNAFLLGKRDRGALNSEFFLTYVFPSQRRVAFGMSHQVIEYEAMRSADKLQRFFDLAFVRYQF